MKYVVEHMEPELHEWCILEYTHIIDKVGIDNVLITNLSPTNELIPASWKGLEITEESFFDLIKRKNTPMSAVVLLDSEAPQQLHPSDSNAFEYFLFGGILGDVDEGDLDRTSELRVSGCACRSLGNLQMTTDTCVITTKMVLKDKIPFEKIEFCDKPEFKISKKERLIVPFRYLLYNHETDKDYYSISGMEDLKRKPRMSKGMLDLLKKDNDLDLF